MAFCVVQLGVLEWFASLWEIKLEESWGYVTNGSTEANLQAMYMAREALPNGKIKTHSIHRSKWLLIVVVI